MENRITEVNGFWFDIEELENKRCNYQVTCKTGEGSASTWFDTMEDVKDYVSYYRDQYDWSVDMARLKGQVLERDYNERGWSRE